MDDTDNKAATPGGDELNLTDRELLVGLIDLVGGLAERLTGEKVGLRIDSFKGHYFTGVPTTRYVTWNGTPTPYFVRERSAAEASSVETTGPTPMCRRNAPERRDSD
jgi:hypothetical protein